MSERAGPGTVPFEQAADAIRAMLAERAGGAGIVGISGPVGSGKSTLADQLGGVVIRTDDYLPDYHTLPEHERDLPERADLALLDEHLHQLAAGRAVEAPTWCFQEHRRIGSRRVEPGRVIVCEGIHALHPAVAETHHVRVYVEAGKRTRWERWERIERESKRGWGVEAAREYFENVAEPTFHARAGAYRALAHLIVDNDR